MKNLKHFTGQERHSVSGHTTQEANISEVALDASDYHPMATVTDLLIKIRDENKTNKFKNEKQQYTYMEFVDKKTGEVSTQRVLF